MDGENRSADPGAATGSQDGTSGDGPSGRMVYHLFGTEERRRIVSIYLDNHSVAFSANAIADATDMDAETVAANLDALAAVGFLSVTDPGEAYDLATSEEAALERIAGDPDGDDALYRVEKDSEIALALAKVDLAAAGSADAFFRAAPDVELTD